MFDLLRLWFGVLLRLFRSRQTVMIENLVLRQQLTVFKRQRRRPRLATMDKLFWVILRRFWSSWKQALIVVTPDTVVRWHRAGFQLYWKIISRVRKPVGRMPVIKEIRELIFRMVAENPTWRAPRIHGELVMLGYEISERSVSRWMRHAPRTLLAMDPALASLGHHPRPLQQPLHPAVADLDLVLFLQFLVKVPHVQIEILLPIQPQNFLHHRQRHSLGRRFPPPPVK